MTVRPQYVTVKNWKTWQHYKDREPPWVKLHSRLLHDDAFIGLSELEQWQLVRIWLVAARASKYTLDGDNRRTPVLSCKEATIRRAIGSSRRVPVDRFIAEGWLIPVDPTRVFRYTAASTTLDENTHDDSPSQAPVDSTLLGTETTEELDTPAAEDQEKSTTSLFGSSYAGTNGNGSNGHSAAAEESPPEHIVRAACQQFGSDLNVVEPLARQLTRAAFDAIVLKMEAKVRRGSADEPWALFTSLLQREIKATLVAHIDVHVPTFDEQFAHEARGLALTTSPAEIIDEMLVKSLNRREIPERDRPRLLELAHSVIDQVRAAA